MASTMATGPRVFFFCSFGFLLLLFSLEGTQGSTNQSMSGLQDHHRPFSDEQQNRILSVGKKKIKAGGKRRTVELSSADYDDFRKRLTAIEQSKRLLSTQKEYSIWRREHGKSREDILLIWMKDQVILARVLTRVAHANKMYGIKNNLSKLVKASLDIIGEANSDAELKIGALEQALKMDRGLAEAKEKVYNCEVVTRKLRAMIKTLEDAVVALKRKSMFLMQVASWTTSKPLHCLHLQLTNDYYLHDQSHTNSPDQWKMEDHRLYHYAIFSDNVLATSVVVASAIANAEDPEKHVFHIITDRLNFAAIKMWFISHPPLLATVEVESISNFKWLNSSYSPVLQQLGSANMEEFYSKSDRPPRFADSNDYLKFMNPKYLSILNHMRFYIPELFPKLDKILFLDDDVVVQTDLTPLWDIDMNGMVNGAVEICKKNLHELGSYLNFENLKISQNFDPCTCAWAFGMNIFDLEQWKLHNLTGVYHYWQHLNEDGQLWQLGTLPPGLVTFYNLTYPLEKKWHLWGLGYQPSISTAKIEEAAVIHYSGNNKPWTDLAISKYKGYWTKYVDFEDPYLRNCNVNP